MRILLLQLDGKLPNVALMRIAAHHRAQGDDVELRNARTVAAVHPGLWDDHHRVYASLIFDSTRPVAEELRRIRPDAIVGGTGWDLSTTVEAHGIETLDQDYSIYPKFTASIGFSQRGCRLECKFCVVPQKEGKVRAEHTIWDLWRGEPYPKNILLLDNDFFGQPEWLVRCNELIAGNFKVSFSQGINARMLDDSTASAIASLRYYDDQFKDRRIYTAWDSRKDEDRLFRGLDALTRNGVKPQQIMVYMLIGYWRQCPKCHREFPADVVRCPKDLSPLLDETHDVRDYRRQRLRDYGARPYPMPFVRSPELVGFQRWVLANGADKTVPWEDWVRANYSPRRAAERHHKKKFQIRMLDG